MPEVYILIIPGFGIISTTISANSNKTVFGQDGPLKKFLMQQTIRRNSVYHILQTTFLFILNNIKINLKNVKMFVQEILFPTGNPPITKAPNFINLKSKIKESIRLSMWVVISEAICLLSTQKHDNLDSVDNSISSEIIEDTNIKNDNLKYSDNNKVFNEWLAGLIDGDGCFQLSKKGYASLEIVMELRDKHCLYIIKQKFGGSVKLRAGDNHLRYRLHHKTGLLNLIKAVNGLIRNPVRMLQLGKICEKYNIDLIHPEPLTYYNGWFAGFFDSDGSVYMNDKSGQLFITASQKNKFLLDALVELYGGKIYTMAKVGAFKWTCYRKDEILKLVNDYFKINPSRSEKRVRLHMVNKFYELRVLHAHNATPASVAGKSWKNFMIKWDKIVSHKV